MSLLEVVGSVVIGLLLLFGYKRLRPSTTSTEYDKKEEELAKDQAKLFAEFEALKSVSDKMVPGYEDMTPEEIEEYWRGKNN